jgi:hypothetical protein
MSAGAIKGHEPIRADAIVMAQARTNCAARLRARGQEAEAAQFEVGERDFSWALRHEVSKLMAERGRTNEDRP